MHAPKLSYPRSPLDAPSKLILTNPSIGGHHLIVDLSIRVCNFEDVPNYNGMNIDLHSLMIHPSQEVIIGLDLHLFTLASISLEIDFSII